MPVRPTSNQVRAARVRAAEEAYRKKHRKPCGGGWLIPSSKQTYEAVARITGESAEAVRFCMTYARQSDHEWSEGACPDCPDADHIPW